MPRDIEMQERDRYLEGDDELKKSYIKPEREFVEVLAVLEEHDGLVYQGLRNIT